MGFFDKAKKYFGMNTMEVELTVQPTFSITDRTITGTITLKAVSDQEIKSIDMEFYRILTYPDRDSEGMVSNKTKRFTFGKTFVEAPSLIKQDEVIKLDYEMPFYYEKTFTERMQSKDGIVGSIFKHSYEEIVNDEYIVEATVDLRDVGWDPSAKAYLKRV